MASHRPKKKVVDQAKHPALLWIRGTGFAGILIGGFTLVSAYFWFSVTAVSFGLLMMFIDLIFEPWNPKLRLPLLILLMMAMAAFWWFIVFRKDPLITGAFQVKPYAMIRVVMDNNTDQDYSDFDMTISTKEPSTLIYEVKQSSELSGCTVLSPYQAAMGDGDSSKFIPPATIISTMRRIHCDHLPEHVNVSFDLIFGTVQLPSAININGHYIGKFRAFHYESSRQVQ